MFIIEYSELEVTQNNHGVQLLALCWTAPKFTLCAQEHCPTLLELCQSGAVTASLGSLFQCSVILW